MKISIRRLLYFYLATVCFLTIYILASIKECDAYWMHDRLITITKRKLFIDTSYLFLLPVVMILVQKIIKITTQANLFLTHYFITLTSILLLLFTINKPCENLNGGHYMFISTTMTIGYYWLKLVSFVIIGSILIQTILLKIRHSKLEKYNHKI